MSFIKKNKFVILAIGIFLIVIILAFQVVSMFFPEEGKALYGERLDGIEEVTISNDKLKKIESDLTSDATVKKANAKVSGKIIEVIITVQDDATVDATKALTTRITDLLSNKEKKFYDIQLFAKKDNEATNFPIIGYKHHAKDTFSWTKDRGE